MYVFVKSIRACPSPKTPLLTRLMALPGANISSCQQMCSVTSSGLKVCLMIFVTKWHNSFLLHDAISASAQIFLNGCIFTIAAKNDLFWNEMSIEHLGFWQVCEIPAWGSSIMPPSTTCFFQQQQLSQSGAIVALIWFGLRLALVWFGFIEWWQFNRPLLFQQELSWGDTIIASISDTFLFNSSRAVWCNYNWLD